MRFLSSTLSALCVLCALCGESFAQPHIVFVTGDDEYGSEVSMPMVADILRERHGMKTTVLYATNEQGERDVHAHNIPGLDALRDADLAVFFTRWRALPQDQLDAILRYAESGKPMIGLRTASHTFKYPSAPNDKYNDGFPRDYFGQQWISHHGHKSSTQIQVVPEQAEHPVLRGVNRQFWVPSWLYIMNHGDLRLPEDCRVLMEGDAVRGTAPGGEKFGTHEPVSWTREQPLDGGGVRRVFYTSLGHPRDLAIESPRRMLVNAIYWGLGREKDIPAEGADVEIVGQYAPPNPQ